MSQNSTSNKPYKSSLPRPSRLPVSRNFEAPPLPRIPAEYHVAVASNAIGNHSVRSDHGSGKPVPRNECVDTPNNQKGVTQQEADHTWRYTKAARIENLFTEKSGSSETLREEARRRPRPSLSDRTIETLSRIPPSPSPRRRRSSFFPSTDESPERNASRPGSSLGCPRPNTSHGQHSYASPTTPRVISPIKRPGIRLPATGITPNKQSASKREGGPQGTPSKQPGPSKSAVPHPAVASGDFSRSLKLARRPETLASRSPKPRSAIVDTFKKPEIPGWSTGSFRSQSQRDVSNQSTESTLSSVLSPTSRKSSQTSQASNESAISSRSDLLQQSKFGSSAALRDTIAKAKAQHRKTAQKGPSAAAKIASLIESNGSLSGADSQHILGRRIETARKDGRLNIAALGLTEIPCEVLNMYDLDTVEASGGKWYESVDITKLIAADNKLTSLNEELFPDKSMDDLRNTDDETQGTLFGGLEALDLHGNQLGLLPIGLRQLINLTVLNLSKNKLTTECFNTISRIETLRELKVADNHLAGALPENICALRHLQDLDLHNNSLETLADGLPRLAQLKNLNVAGNRLRFVQLELFHLLPIVELDLSRNRLEGTLLPGVVKGFQHLQILDVSSNNLTSLSDHPMASMPKIQSLNISENHIQILPNISFLTALTSLLATNNKLTSLPAGMTVLSSLRNIDLAGNNIKKLDNQIAVMEKLSVLNIANNPLRERRYLTMNTEDLIQDLRQRLLPSELDEGLEDTHGSRVMNSTEELAGSEPWPMKPGGVLDKSFSNLSRVDPSDLEALPSSVRSVTLDHNKLSVIPTALGLLTSTLSTLDLSHNKLTGSTYLSTSISLHSLRDLSLASNTITSLDPLVANLYAPRLETLNVSYNRLVTLPTLRSSLPELATVQASDNQIAELPVENVRGLQFCNVARNDIGYLDPHLGLLDSEGLRTLVVEGNRFRVPRREVVESGTEKLLTWLKGRIPLS